MRNSRSSDRLRIGFVALVLAIAVAWIGCGGEAGVTPPVTTLPPPAPDLRVEIRSETSFHFTWDDVAGENLYRLLEDPDGATGFDLVTVIEANRTSYDHAVSLTDRVNARYVLQACNDGGCEDSDEVSIAEALASGILYLKASNTEEQDAFGASVALSGDGGTLVVGAPTEDGGAREPKHPGDSDYASSQEDNSSSRSGAVYVFTRDGDTWHQEAYVKAWNADSGDRFGTSIALSDDGDTLAVGAPEEDGNSIGGEVDNTLSTSGAAYVFVRVGATWYPEYYIKASNPGSQDRFARDLALSGDGGTLVVGADGEDSFGTPGDDLVLDSGAAYIFVRDASTWYQEAFLKALNVTPDDAFGDSLALSADGNVLAVGCPNDDSGLEHPYDDTAPRCGAVHVYTRSGGVWTRRFYAKASNLDAADHFGTAVDLSADGNLLVVGASGEDGNGTHPDDDSVPDSGAVYVFRRDGNLWDEISYLKVGESDEEDRLGFSVRISGDGLTVAAGVPGESSQAVGVGGDASDNSASGSGAVHLFVAPAGNFQPYAYVKAPNTDAEDFFGWCTALSDDGLTLVVGAWGEDGAATGVGGDASDDSVPVSGAVYLYRDP